MAQVHKRKENCIECGRVYNVNNREIIKGYCFYCKKKRRNKKIW